MLNAQGRSWKRDKVADSAGWIQNSDFDHSEHFECGLPALFADKGLCGIGTSPVIWKSTTLYTQSICHQDTYITHTTLLSPPPYTFGTTRSHGLLQNISALNIYNVPFHSAASGESAMRILPQGSTMSILLLSVSSNIFEAPFDDGISTSSSNISP